MRLNLYNWAFYVFHCLGVFRLAFNLQGCTIPLCSVNWSQGVWTTMPGTCLDPSITNQHCMNVKSSCNTTLVLQKVGSGPSAGNITSFDLVKYSPRSCSYEDWRSHQFLRKVKNGQHFYSSRNLCTFCNREHHLILCSDFSKSTVSTVSMLELSSIKTTIRYQYNTTSLPRAPTQEASKVVLVVVPVSIVCFLVITLLTLIWLVLRKRLNRVLPVNKCAKDTGSVEDVSDESTRPSQENFNENELTNFGPSKDKIVHAQGFFDKESSCGL